MSPRAVHFLFKGTAMTPEHRDRADYLIYHADKLLERYDKADMYDHSLEVVVEELNCRVEKLVGCEL